MWGRRRSGPFGFASPHAAWFRSQPKTSVAERDPPCLRAPPRISCGFARSLQSRPERTIPMPLSRFSSETVGGSSGLGTGGPPRADGPVTLAVPTVSPDIDDWRQDAFELPLDEGLDFFRSERNGEPAAPDGLAEALPAFGPSNGAPFGAPFGAPVGAPVGNDATGLEPARAKAVAAAPPTARTPGSLSASASIHSNSDRRHRAERGEHTDHCGPARAGCTAQARGACCSCAPSRNASHAAGPSSRTRTRWRPRASPQVVLVAVLFVGGALEAGWLGVRLTRAVSGKAPRPVASAGFRQQGESPRLPRRNRPSSSSRFASPLRPQWWRARRQPCSRNRPSIPQPPSGSRYRRSSRSRFSKEGGVSARVGVEVSACHQAPTTCTSSIAPRPWTPTRPSTSSPARRRRSSWSLWKGNSASRRGIGTDGPELLV